MMQDADKGGKHKTMPNEDRYHQVVKNALIKAGWTILQEQFYIAVAAEDEIARRLYIDLHAKAADTKIVLFEVKALENSPVHEMMQLVGQYMFYRAALDLDGDSTPLYVAIPRLQYQKIVIHSLTRTALSRLSSPIPFVIFDPEREEIVEWIPPL